MNNIVNYTTFSLILTAVNGLLEAMQGFSLSHKRQKQTPDILFY